MISRTMEMPSCPSFINFLGVVPYRAGGELDSHFSASRPLRSSTKVICASLPSDVSGSGECASTKLCQASSPEYCSRYTLSSLSTEYNHVVSARISSGWCQYSVKAVVASPVSDFVGFRVIVSSDVVECNVKTFPYIRVSEIQCIFELKVFSQRNSRS